MTNVPGLRQKLRKRAGINRQYRALKTQGKTRKDEVAAGLARQTREEKKMALPRKTKNKNAAPEPGTGANFTWYD